MTATAVLDRTTTKVAAPAPTPRRPSGDDEYARQLNRRLADERSSARKSSTALRGASDPDTAIQNRDSTEPTSRSSAAPPAKRLSNNPTVAHRANEESTSWTAEPAASESFEETGWQSDVDHRPTTPPVPPVPWQQDHAADVALQKPAPETPFELPATAKAPGLPHDVSGHDGDEESVPRGLGDAHDATSSPSQGNTAPSGLAVAFDAVQQRLTKATGNSRESTAEATLASTRSADTQPTDAGTPNVEPVYPDGNPTHTHAAAIVDNVITPQTSPVGTGEQASVYQLSAAEAVTSSEATQPAIVVSSEFRSPAVEENSDHDASSDDESSQRSSLHNSGQKNSVQGREHASSIVGDATMRAVEAVKSSTATPAASGQVAVATNAIPAALHAALIERVTDTVEVPDSTTGGSNSTATLDAALSTIRSDAKVSTPSAGAWVQGQSHSAVDLADGLPRHAAAALRAAAGFDRPIRIRLSPAELGALHVEVSRHQGALHARFEVTTSAAQLMLNEHLPALRESLGRAGLPIDRIDVRLVESAQDEARSDSQSHSNSGGEYSEHGGEHRERFQSELQAPDDASPEALTRKAAHRVAPNDTQSQSRTQVLAADLLDIQI